MRIVWKQALDFLSRLDQEGFDAWLGSIDGVEPVKGLGHLIEFDIPTDTLSDESLRELIALYLRYSGDLSELVALETDANRQWLRDEGSRWFRGMYGDDGS